MHLFSISKYNQQHRITLNDNDLTFPRSEHREQLPIRDDIHLKNDNTCGTQQRTTLARHHSMQKTLAIEIFIRRQHVSPTTLLEENIVRKYLVPQKALFKDSIVHINIVHRNSFYQKTNKCQHLKVDKKEYLWHYVRLCTMSVQ